MINSKTKTLLLILFLNGCIQIPPVNFKIENKSSYLIDIKLYTKGQINESFSIEINKSFSRIGDGKSVTPYAYETDSIEVIFDKKRKFVQYCDGKRLFGNFGICRYDKNLMDFEGVAIRKGGNVFRKSSKTITFDNSDYEKAIPF